MLPRGGGLPLEEWRRRHAGIMVLLWINVLAVPIVSLAGGRFTVVHAIESGLGVGVLATFAALPRMPRQLRMASASLGLLSAAAMLIHALGGLLEMHFYFFVLIIVLTLYEDWMPFLLALVFVLIHHGVYGTIDPKAVFDRRTEWEDPWLWAGIHALASSLRREARRSSPGGSTRTYARGCARRTRCSSSRRRRTA